MSVDTTFLLLSDLHFGNDLFEAAGTQLLNVPCFFSAQKLTTFFEERCRGHHLPCVKRLPRYLKLLLSDLKEEGYQGNEFDLLILLGDQSTLAHERSYKFLREYITQSLYETSDGDSKTSCSGLAIDPSNILAIPGNHDKLLRTSLNLYHDEFTRKVGIREKVRPQMCSIAIKRFAGREFVFILVEPSNYCKQDLKLGSDFRSHLAAGTVTKKLAEDLQIKLGILKQHGKLDAEVRLQGTFNDAVKILVVHYAVDDGQFSSGLQKILPHECDGLGNLVKALQEQYQLSMAMHGHLHQPLIYNFNDVQVLSAGTATRVDKGAKTGFFVVKVLDSGTIRAEHHIWNG